MSYRGLGGLAGKARRAATFDRFERRLSRGSVEEYHNPTPLGSGFERYIPVRHGSEVLSKVGFSDPDNDQSPFLQLDLPFSPEWDRTRDESGVAAIAREAKPDVAWKPSRLKGPVTVVRSPTMAGKRTPGKASEAIIPSRLRGAAGQPSSERSEFELRRFLTGCLLGGSAAAALLAVMYLLTG